MLVIAGVLVALGAVGTPAFAHDDSGNLSLDAVARADGTVEVQVALSYTNDGHPADAAEVSATASGPGGATAGPVALTPIGLGGYRGTLSSLDTGAWTVRAESTAPAATAETTVEIAERGTPATPDPDDTTPDGAPGDTADDGVGSGGDGDDGGSGAVPWIVGAVVLVALLGAGAWLLRRRAAG